jgi:hypothetical protein
MTVIVLLSREDMDRALLRMARALAPGRTLALRVGPGTPQEEDLLRAALCRGAGRAVRLWDPSCAGVDYLGLAHALARAVGHLGGTLVLAGDRGQGAVGPALAERLGVPHVCGVISASWAGAPDPEKGAAAVLPDIIVQRRTRTGIQVLRGPAGAVLCVCQQAAGGEAPGAGNGRPDAAVEVLGFQQIGLSPGELSPWRRLQPEAPAGEVPGPPRFDTPEALLARLRRDGLWPLGPGTGE